MSNYTTAKQVITSIKYAKHILIIIRKGPLVKNNVLVILKWQIYILTKLSFFAIWRKLVLTKIMQFTVVDIQIETVVSIVNAY